MKVLVGSNIPMVVAGAGHANREPAWRLLERVRNGALEACASSEVLREVRCRYSALGRLDLAWRVYDLFVEICPVVLDVTLADTDRARDLLCGIQGISARDAVHAAVMLNHRLEWIATFDAGFDRVPGIRRWKL